MKLLALSMSFAVAFALLCTSCCNLECGACQELDEENCECVDIISCFCNNGIQDRNETGIDCGGDCRPCLDCTTDYCTFLSGAKSNKPIRLNVPFTVPVVREVPGLMPGEIASVTGENSSIKNDPANIQFSQFREIYLLLFLLTCKFVKDFNF
jgi:hypothetical protein